MRLTAVGRELARGAEQPLPRLTVTEARLIVALSQGCETLRDIMAATDLTAGQILESAVRLADSGLVTGFPPSTQGR